MDLRIAGGRKLLGLRAWLGGRAIARKVKRTVDVVVAGFLLLVSAPLMAVVAFLVAMDGGPVFYVHPRIGANGRSFGCIKFRTMIVDAADCLAEYLQYHPAASEEWRRAQKLRFDPRITGVGRILRRLSLDEVPQFINVLKGEMSMVGPRPVTELELEERYGPSRRLYVSIRPGITGPWQVSGRNELDYAQRVRLDCDYAARWTIWNDFQIMLETGRVVLSRRGAR